MKTQTEAKNYIIIISLFLIMAAGVSLNYSLGLTEHRHEDLATATGRSFFQAFVAARKWNAEHNGVYVPVTETFQPNPYLVDPLRDVTTTAGMKLTKVNPAYMTRLISAILQKKEDIQVHITSLNLLRPANKPDDWEKQALEKFEKAVPEAHAILKSDGKPVFRYMAPLFIEQSCLKCHGKQGYKLGDVRGGISVSFSYVPFQKIIAGDRRQLISLHFSFLLIGLGITYFLGRKLMRRVNELQNALLQIRKLEGILPICSNCKKIRTERLGPKQDKAWVNIEEYISDKTDAEFSHGICPECMKKLYPNIK